MQEKNAKLMTPPETQTNPRKNAFLGKIELLKLFYNHQLTG